MAQPVSRSERRVGVILNYVALALTLAVVYWGEATEWNTAMTIMLVLAVAVLALTLFRYHLATGLWRMAHTKIDKLDERQVQVTHDALRHSYAVFTILALIALLWKALLPGEDPNLIMVFAVLLYVAHTLPSSMIAWSEPEV